MELDGIIIADGDSSSEGELEAIKWKDMRLMRIRQADNVM